MEEVRSGFLAKTSSVECGGHEYGIFWGATLGETLDKHKIVVDLNKLTDNKTMREEAIKLLYGCMLHYRTIAPKIGIDIPQQLPTLAEWEVCFEFNNAELEKGVQYITSQILANNPNKKKE